MKRAIFVVASCFTIYMMWWQTYTVYDLVYAYQDVLPVIFVKYAIKLVPMVLCLVMGIMLRRVLFWPFRFMRERSSERATSEALAMRYKSAKRTMDKTVRRV